MTDAKSRYGRIAPEMFQVPSGAQAPHVARRMLPLPGGNPTWSIPNLRSRLDVISPRALGAALASWRFVDANAAMDPFVLSEDPGSVLSIPSPKT